MDTDESCCEEWTSNVSGRLYSERVTEDAVLRASPLTRGKGATQAPIQEAYEEKQVINRESRNHA
jgi:hypothetical protein